MSEDFKYHVPGDYGSAAYSFHAERNPDRQYSRTITSTYMPATLFTAKGYTGHEMLDAFEIINMNGRIYDPVIARFFSPDPYVQAPQNPQNLNRYSYCLNNPLVYTDPSGEIIFTSLALLIPGAQPLLPIAIGADIGWITGGIRGARTEGMTFMGGAWRGAAVGAIGGGLSMIGGGSMPFIANLALGTGSGALTGGLDAALWGNDIGESMLWGAAAGAVFTTLTSENFSNALKGEGFYTNENVFNDMMDRGMKKQAILDYFGFDGRYVGKTANSPDYIAGNDFYGSTNPKTGEVKYGDLAFDSYNKLKFTYYKEKFHSLRIKNNVELETQMGLGKKYRYFPEERLGFIHAYKNQGFYPHHNINIMSQIHFYNLDPTISYVSKWWHFLYKIPRRW